MSATHRRLVDVLIAIVLIALLALVLSGGYRVELGPFRLKSHSLINAGGLLCVLILLRLLLAYGWSNFVLICISLSLALAGAEAVLRFMDAPLSQPNLTQIHRASPVYGWELIPGAAGVGKEGEIIKINSAGFRDREWVHEKPPGTLRIAVLGDSFTFGMAVALEDAYVKQLERLLNRGDIRVEVLNFGVIGYGMWQYLSLLERKVLPYRPDLIVIGFFLDDVLAPTPPYETDPDWKPKNPFEEAVRDEFNGSYLWNLIRNMDRVFQMKYRYNRTGQEYLKGIDDRKRHIGPGNEYYAVQTGNADQALYERFRLALDRFSQITAKHEIPLVTAYIPDASQIDEPDRQHVNAFLARVTAELGIPFVDLTARFEGTRDPRALFLFPLDAHTSPDGHRHIAAELARLLQTARLGIP